MRVIAIRLCNPGCPTKIKVERATSCRIVNGNWELAVE